MAAAAQNERCGDQRMRGAHTCAPLSHARACRMTHGHHNCVSFDQQIIKSCGRKKEKKTQKNLASARRGGGARGRRQRSTSMHERVNSQAPRGRSANRSDGGARRAAPESAARAVRGVKSFSFSFLGRNSFHKKGPGRRVMTPGPSCWRCKSGTGRARVQAARDGHPRAGAGAARMLHSTARVRPGRAAAKEPFFLLNRPIFTIDLYSPKKRCRVVSAKKKGGRTPKKGRAVHKKLKS